MNLDIEKVTDLIVKETGRARKSARITAELLTKVHADLEPVVSAWMEGKQVDYVVRGLSIFDVMKKENEYYVHAILRMNRFTREPESIDEYKNFSMKKKR